MPKMSMNKRKITRSQFEGLFAGEWEKKRGDRYRINGQFQTSVIGKWKILKMKNFALRAESWQAIYDKLQLKNLQSDQDQGEE